MKAWIISAMLAYVPQIATDTAMMIVKALIRCRGKLRPVSQFTAQSMSGGKMKASALELIAPTNEMKRPKLGMHSARITVTADHWSYP